VTPNDIEKVEIIDKGSYVLIPNVLKNSNNDSNNVNETNNSNNDNNTTSDDKEDNDKNDNKPKSNNNNNNNDNKKFVSVLCISDTHTKHNLIEQNFGELPNADILIHGGDFTNVGKLEDIVSYDTWIQSLVQKRNKFKHSILIAGNHDVTLDFDYYHTIGQPRFHPSSKQDVELCRQSIKNSIYLLDELYEIDGVKIYGSPWQPEFYNWAFNLPRGKAIMDKWNLIPKDVDILITHGPPVFHGDQVVPDHVQSEEEFGQYVGCYDLLKKVIDIKPKYHIFGHIHEGYGITKQKNLETIFINASSVNVQYRVTNKPIMFYIEPSSSATTSNQD